MSSNGMLQSLFITQSKLSSSVDTICSISDHVLVCILCAHWTANFLTHAIQYLEFPVLANGH